MDLLPDDLRRRLPPLSRDEYIDYNPWVYIKYFHSVFNYTWFVTEGEQFDDVFMFFGYFIASDEEWGNFTLDELLARQVERDLYFEPGFFKDVLETFTKERGR
jgi:hypothetical protein